MSTSTRQKIRVDLDILRADTGSPATVIVGRHGEILERSVTVSAQVEASLGNLAVDELWTSARLDDVRMFKPAVLLGSFPGSTHALFLPVFTKLAIIGVVSAATREAALINGMKALAISIRYWMERRVAGEPGGGDSGDEAVAWLSEGDLRSLKNRG